MLVTAARQVGLLDDTSVGADLSHMVDASITMATIAGNFRKPSAPVHDKYSGTCLANLARQVIPDISSRTYHRTDIVELIRPKSGGKYQCKKS